MVQIKDAIEALQKDMMEMGQAMYQQPGATPGPEADQQQGGSGPEPKAGGDDVIDAEFSDTK